MLVTLDIDTLRLIHKTPTSTPNVTFPQLRRDDAPHLPDSSRRSTSRFKKVGIFFFCCLLENGWGNPVETSCLETLTAGVVRKKYQPTLPWRRRSKLILFWQLLHGFGPPPLRKLSFVSSRCSYNLRNSNSLGVPSCSSSSHSSSFLPSCCLLNHLPVSITSCSSLSSFASSPDSNIDDDKFSGSSSLIILFFLLVYPVHNYFFSFFLLFFIYFFDGSGSVSKTMT